MKFQTKVTGMTIGRARRVVETVAHPSPVVRRVSVAGLSLALLVCALVFSSCRNQRSQKEAVRRATANEQALPPMFLWIWERPEDLHALRPSQEGVAVLEGTLRLGHSAIFHPRRNPYVLPPHTAMIAVVRIETAPAFATHHSDRALLRQVVQQLVRVGSEQGIAALQIDFDAHRSERPFYRNVLEQTRGSLPQGMPLEMTALVSWCAEDDWIADLPVNRAIPMFFRMEPGRLRLSQAGRLSAVLPEPLCKSSVGVSTGEPWPSQISDRRVYLFSDLGWRVDYPRLASGERWR